MGAVSTVAVYAPSGVATIGLGMVSAVFQKRADWMPSFELVVCTAEPGPLATDMGATVQVEHGLDAMIGTDLVVVLGTAAEPEEPDDELVEALRAAHRSGATVAGSCIGVYPLAATGLLDGLDVTTHWAYADDLARRFPRLTLRPGALYIDHGRVVTGAGASAGMDLFLHLLRRDHGAALTNAVARALVTPPHREGGQQQFIAAPVPAGTGHRFNDILAWARDNLQLPLSVDELARHALMSKRSFIRHFKAATGTTPHAWVHAQRLSRAEELLETTDLAVETVAHRVGYRSAAVLRDQFTAHRGCTPREYRRTFSHR